MIDASCPFEAAIPVAMGHAAPVSSHRVHLRHHVACFFRQRLAGDNGSLARLVNGPNVQDAVLLSF
jgi:hypothetical protein